MASSPQQKYIYFFAVTLIILMSVVSLINLVVDPSSRLDLINRDGFNSAKVTLKPNSRNDKVAQILQCNFDTFLVGTSRTETGINPDDVPITNSGAYNASLKKTSMFETAGMVDFILANQHPKAIVFGLDFLAFSTKYTAYENYYVSRLAKRQSILSFVPYLLSLETLVSSYYTVYWSRDASVDACARNGFQDPRELEVEQNLAFRSMLERFRNDPESYNNFVSSDERLLDLETSMDKSIAANTEVYLFISPLHATHLELMQEIGLYETFENWKRRLVVMVSDINKRTGKKLILWDFSGYNTITTEQVPAAKDTRQMNWYRDSSHYRPSAGKFILQRIFSVVYAGPDDFGVPLTESNVEKELNSQRQLAESRTMESFFESEPAGK